MRLIVCKHTIQLPESSQLTHCFQRIGCRSHARTSVDVRRLPSPLRRFGGVLGSVLWLKPEGQCHVSLAVALRRLVHSLRNAV